MDDPSEGNLEMGRHLKQTKGEMVDPTTSFVKCNVISGVSENSAHGEHSEIDASAKGRGELINSVQATFYSLRHRRGRSSQRRPRAAEPPAPLAKPRPPPPLAKPPPAPPRPSPPLAKPPPAPPRPSPPLAKPPPAPPKPKPDPPKPKAEPPKPKAAAPPRPSPPKPKPDPPKPKAEPKTAAPPTLPVSQPAWGRGENIPELTLAASMRQLLRNTPTAGSSGSCCIYKVPRTFLRVDEDAYAPLVVTLGPLRCGYVTTETVEIQKWRYFQEALSLIGDVGLVGLLQEVKRLEQSARRCYSEAFDDIDSNEFVQMMVLDGCFIIQILLKETRRRSFSSDDHIFQQRLLFHDVKRDLMLLQNQIPFFLLERLFGVLAPYMGITDSLITVVQNFFQDRMKGPIRLYGPKHLLHLLHTNLFPDVDGRQLNSSFTPLKPFPGATYLLEAGVEFSSSGAYRLDITFDDGVVKIPHLTVEDGTNSLFLNLIAFEQLHPDSIAHVTAYTSFMHCLIKTAQDVSVLCRKGVIDNWLGSDQEVADLFSRLNRYIAIYPDEVYMSDVIGRIHEYSSKRRNNWRANFIHNYVRKPWAIVSLTAATILLMLALMQTFFAMFAYFKPPS